MFEQLFGSRTRAKILRLFLVDLSTGSGSLARGGASFYVRQISRQIGEHLNSVRRELENLKKLGLLLPRRRNKKQFWWLNPDFVLLSELKALFMKSYLLIEGTLTDKLEKLGQVNLLVLTGFFTGLDSPVDLLIVGRLNRRRVGQVIKSFEKKLAHPINYTIMSSKEFKMRRELTDRFLFDILENKKIVLINKLGI